jgi:hypothetical protein
MGHRSRCCSKNKRSCRRKCNRYRSLKKNKFIVDREELDLLIAKNPKTQMFVDETGYHGYTLLGIILALLKLGIPLAFIYYLWSEYTNGPGSPGDIQGFLKFIPGYLAKMPRDVYNKIFAPTRAPGAPGPSSASRSFSLSGSPDEYIVNLKFPEHINLNHDHYIRKIQLQTLGSDNEPCDCPDKKKVREPDIIPEEEVIPEEEEDTILEEKSPEPPKPPPPLPPNKPVYTFSSPPGPFVLEIYLPQSNEESRLIYGDKNKYFTKDSKQFQDQEIRNIYNKDMNNINDYIGMVFRSSEGRKNNDQIRINRNRLEEVMGNIVMHSVKLKYYANDKPPGGNILEILNGKYCILSVTSGTLMDLKDIGTLDKPNEESYTPYIEFHNFNNVLYIIYHKNTKDKFYKFNNENSDDDLDNEPYNNPSNVQVQGNKQLSREEYFSRKRPYEVRD